MDMPRKEIVIAALQAHNSGMSQRKMALKYEKMDLSAYSFFRGSNHLFWADISPIEKRSIFTTKHTRTWLQGDLHVYNYGAFNNDEGDLVYGLNDFDDGVIADYQYDIWRMATSILLITRENGTSSAQLEAELVLQFTDSYLKQLQELCQTGHKDPNSYTMTRASGCLKTFLQEIDQDNSQSRQKMLDKWTQKGRQTFKLESGKLAAVTDSENKALREAIAGHESQPSPYRTTLKGPLQQERASYFQVLDVAERCQAGTGSLGSKRYYVLINASHSRGGDNRILDVKRQGPATAFAVLSEEDRNLNNFINDAERTVEAFRALSKHTDDHLGWILLPKLAEDAPAGAYSIRELTPEKESYPALASDFEEGNEALKAQLTLEKKSNFLSMCNQWGEILADSHARADNNFNRARIIYSFEKEVSKVIANKRKEFCQLAYGVARDYAVQVEIDYNIFKQWWK